MSTADTALGGNCRFYEAAFPELEECVMVNVKRIAEMGAYVQLLEYNNLEGMILLSELSRRRIRSINKLLRVGKNEVVMVIRVDKEKGYIDLSKRRVSAEDIRRTDERFNKSKSVHAVLRHLSSRLRTPMLSLYSRIGWPLSKRFGHAYDAFQSCVLDEASVFGQLADVTPDERRECVAYVKTKMMPQPLKIRADIQVTCFTYEGINALKEALLAGQALSTDAVPIKVQLIAPPLYVMLTITTDKDAGIERLNAAIAEVKRVLDAKGGSIVVKMAPSVTSAQDDSELARMLEGLAVEDDEEGGGSDGEGGAGAKGGEDDEEGLGDADFEAGAGVTDFASLVSGGPALPVARPLPPAAAAAASAAAAVSAAAAAAAADAAEAATAAAAAAAAAAVPAPVETESAAVLAGAAPSFGGAKKKKKMVAVAGADDD